MKVKDIINVQCATDVKPFEIIVKEKGEPLKYKCYSNNVAQKYDFLNREVYNISFDESKVYCW